MSQKIDSINYDVVVVGAGYAGLSAALEAARAGAQVVVLGRIGKFANNSSLAGGAFALVDTPMQAARKINDSPELLASDILKANGNSVDTEIVDIAARQAIELYGWLTDIGASFYDVVTYPGHSVPRCHLEVGLSGANVVKAFHSALETKGVDIRLGTVAQHLLLEGSRIAGVLALGDGEQLEIRSEQGVVLAAGGFGKNKAMMRQYLPELADFACLSGNGSTGDGIRMGIEAGADTQHMDSALLSSLACAYKGHRIAGEVLAKGAILVNKQGKRFVDETLGYVRTAMPMKHQLNSTALLIIDEGIRNTITKMSHYLEQGLFITGASAKELASQVGIDAQALQETIDEYNTRLTAGAGAGREVKRPALRGMLYGTWVKPAVLQTNGGLKVNNRMQVMSTQGRPISHLYAAGDSTAGLGGAATADCPCPGYLTGCGFLWALASGRIAGKNIYSQ